MLIVLKTLRLFVFFDFILSCSFLGKDSLRPFFISNLYGSVMNRCMACRDLDTLKNKANGSNYKAIMPVPNEIKVMSQSTHMTKPGKRQVFLSATSKWQHYTVGVMLPLETVFQGHILVIFKCTVVFNEF